MGLYEEPEKPSNALEFVQNNLHGGGPHTADVESLKAENSNLKKQLEEVRMLVFLCVCVCVDACAPFL